MNGPLLASPTVFDGDPEKMSNFLDQLFILFVARPDDFSTDGIRIATALSFIEGPKVAFWKKRIVRQAMDQGTFGTWLADDERDSGDDLEVNAVTLKNFDSCSDF